MSKNEPLFDNDVESSLQRPLLKIDCFLFEAVRSVDLMEVKKVFYYTNAGECIMLP